MTLPERIKTAVLAHREIISYLFWGVMTTLVSWVSYSLLVTAGLGIASANALSWVCAVLFAFVVNKLWVFCSKSWELSLVLSELWRFIAARLLTGLLEVVGVPFLVSIGLNQTIFGIEGMLAKVTGSLVVMVLNYVASKLLVFGSKG